MAATPAAGSIKLSLLLLSIQVLPLLRPYKTCMHAYILVNILLDQAILEMSTDNPNQLGCVMEGHRGTAVHAGRTGPRLTPQHSLHTCTAAVGQVNASLLSGVLQAQLRAAEGVRL
jgi:hypothetical protein